MSVHVDIIAELQKRSVDRAAAELDSAFHDQKVDVGVDVKSTEIRAAAEKIKREFGDIRQQVKIDLDKNGFSQATRGFKDVENAAGSADRAVNTFIGSVLNLRGPTALIGGGAAVLVDGLIQVAQQATAATQALWLLPAGAVAAGAGIGTLAIATHGFSDAIKDMGDPKKFAEDLQLLSPAAQQAALQIKNLVDGPLGQLKAATQDTFFAGMSDEINRLVTTYLPSLQSMTTSIAGSFNQMMHGVANQLMTPETQASLQTMFSNITQTFQNLAPAVAPVVKAFTDIATVGSGFLPGLATSITNAANSFATFISNARETGQLQVWIQQGIDAVKNLAGAAWELIQIWYRLFGPETKTNIDSNIAGVSALKETVASYGADLHKISDIIGLVMADSHTWSVKWNEEMLSMQGPLGSFRDMILDIPEAMATAWNGVKHVIDDMVTNLVTDLNHMADILPDTVNKKLFGTEHPKPFSFTPLPDAPVGDWSGYQSTTGPFGGPGQPGLGGDANAQRQRQGRAPVGIGGPPPPGPLFPVPPLPPGPAGAKPSDRERLDAIKAGLDPSLYHVDPFAPVPGMPSPGALAGGPMPDGGYGAASGQDFFEGQQKIISQAHDLEERRKDRLALERDNQSTAEQINDAKWQEHLAEVDLQKAQADLVDKTKGTATQAKKGMDDLSAALDPDLGLSKGLSGFADNLVRFVGNLAFAPEMARLDALKQANEAQTGITGGYGLLGISGAKNLSQGLSPLLGNPLPTDGTTASTTPAGLGGVASSVYQPSAGGYVGDAALLSHVPATGTYDNATKNLSQGLADCSSAVEDLVNIMDGRSTVGGSLTTMNAAQLLPGMGFQRGMGGPGDFRIGYNSGHMQATLPGGTPFNYGSESSIDRGGVGGSGADDPSFTDHWFRPAGAGGSTGMPGADDSTANFGSGSIPIPLPVTIVGAGSIALPGSGGAPTTGGSTGSPAATSGLNWDALAQKEAGGDWGNTSDPKYRGGLQFDIPTWNQFKPAGAPADPATASKELQIAAAQNALNSGRTPQSLWPTNYGQLGTASTGIPAPAGASPAVADILSRMPANSGAPLAPGGGQGPILPQWQPTPGAGLGTGPLPGPPQGQYGAQVETGYTGGGGGGVGITPGGTIDTAMNLAASAFPGVGQAAATGMKLGSRAIQYAGQVAGIGVQGLMDTFLPTGGSELANNSWLTRIVGGLAGATPQIPNLAGKEGKDKAPGPLTPDQAQQQPLVGPAAAPPINVTYNNNGATEDRAGADLAHNLGQMYAPAGTR